jgi:hypothetical protein
MNGTRCQRRRSYPTLAARAKAIEVRGELSGMPMITLPPGVRLRGGTPVFGAKGCASQLTLLPHFAGASPAAAAAAKAARSGRTRLPRGARRHATGIPSACRRPPSRPGAGPIPARPHAAGVPPSGRGRPGTARRSSAPSAHAHQHVTRPARSCFSPMRESAPQASRRSPLVRSSSEIRLGAGLCSRR